MHGKVAFITGASSGIGKASALAFANQGARVVLMDVTPNGQHVAEMIKKETGQETLFIQADVSKGADVERAINETIKKFGRLDYAFNNAGIEGQPANTVECTEENWNKTMDINLKGVWLCMKHQIPHMLKGGGGSIVNCASIAGLVGFTNIPAYVASKHGIVGLTKTAALEFAKSGIRVNAVCPGVIQTPMIDRFTKGSQEGRVQLEASEPVGRMGRPEEIADVAVWLCSDHSSFVTGHALAADGGWVAQ